MEKYALIGKNIQDSLSPVIHGAYGCQYDLLDVEEGQLEWALSQPYDGFNVTSPYKEKVCKFLKRYWSHSGVINTIVKEPYRGDLFGYDTDSAGFEIALAKNGINLGDGTVNIIGMGAMAQMIESLVVMRGGKARMLDSRHDNYSFGSGVGVVNASPRQNISFIGSPAWIMDLGYKDDTFVRSARKSHPSIVAFNGMGMLIAQAEESQRIWNS